MSSKPEWEGSLFSTVPKNILYMTKPLGLPKGPGIWGLGKHGQSLPWNGALVGTCVGRRWGREARDLTTLTSVLLLTTPCYCCLPTTTATRPATTRSRTVSGGFLLWGSAQWSIPWSRAGPGAQVTLIPMNYWITSQYIPLWFKCTWSSTSAAWPQRFRKKCLIKFQKIFTDQSTDILMCLSLLGTLILFVQNLYVDMLKLVTKDLKNE